MKKMNTQNSVQMPLATLKAIKEMLFTKTGNGIDLTNIIEDLSIGGSCDNELVSINVALAYNGYTPKIEESPRYDYYYDSFYYEYKMLKHSLILDTILVERVQYLVEGDSERKTTDYIHTLTISHNEWMKLSTTKTEILEKIKNKKK